MPTDHMNCGFCCTRHPIEAMGEHGWGKCGQQEGGSVAFGAQWMLENWHAHIEDHDGWQDVLEDVTEQLFPHQYGEIMAREGNEGFTEDDESTMMRAETNAERQITIDFISRVMFEWGITTEQIARKMEEHE